MKNDRRKQIICAILKGKNYFNEIQEELNLKKPVVSEYLKNLREEGLIEEYTDQEDKRRKYYKISLSIDNLKRLIRKYPDLIPKLQKSNEIIDFIVKSNNIHFFVDDVRKMLKTSPSFFKMLVLTPFEEYLKIMNSIDFIILDFKEIGVNLRQINYQRALLNLFLIAVWNDVVEQGISTKSAQTLKEIVKRNAILEEELRNSMTGFMLLNLLKVVTEDDQIRTKVREEIKKIEKQMNELAKKIKEREITLEEYGERLIDLLNAVYKWACNLSRSKSHQNL